MKTFRRQTRRLFVYRFLKLFVGFVRDRIEIPPNKMRAHLTEDGNEIRQAAFKVIIIERTNEGFDEKRSVNNRSKDFNLTLMMKSVIIIASV
ncbi:hypothetical protein CEXT_85551 [Caerostris extrusa]|uniref:Uncharacterized protein n=1 Tax=Caerostris extrusa TaxID=172846 RepID=A0AAV4XHJ3_CAEEX|nr:hypothetical protein CEXT_85551 [Caerostris extrusa]